MDSPKPTMFVQNSSRLYWHGHSFAYGTKCTYGSIADTVFSLEMPEEIARESSSSQLNGLVLERPDKTMQEPPSFRFNGLALFVRMEPVSRESPANIMIPTFERDGIYDARGCLLEKSKLHNRTDYYFSQQPDEVFAAFEKFTGIPSFSHEDHLHTGYSVLQKIVNEREEWQRALSERGRRRLPGLRRRLSIPDDTTS